MYQKQKRTFNPTVTIVIPVYNVELYIERCARSLYEQSYPYIEYIWVNDASEDKSIQILKEITKQYSFRDSSVVILEHGVNKGLPSARNTGLAASRGEYIFHCDSDDVVDPDMISCFMDDAIRNNSDIVYSDWFLSFKKNERYMQQPAYTTSKECVKAMLSGCMRFNVWNKLVRRRLYMKNEIIFPSGYGMGEDITMIKLFIVAERVSYLPKAFYHYMQQNPKAFTKVFSEEHWQQLYHNVFDIKDFIKKRYGDLYVNELHFFCLNVKLPLLITNDYSSYERWLVSFTESNIYINSNHLISSRIRWVQRMAVKRNFWLVRAHYYLIIKVIYGIIYR